MSDILLFNTGRHYSINCQRIAARKVGDRVFFFDVDRNISGVIDDMQDTDFYDRIILQEYDNKNYRGTKLGEEYEIERNLKAEALEMLK